VSARDGMSRGARPAFGPALVVGAALAVCPPAGAAADLRDPEYPRFRLGVNGVTDGGTLRFSQSQPFTEFAEEGRLAADYEARRAPGLEADVQFSFARHLGLAVSFDRIHREARAAYTATLPHPLYLGRPRIKNGRVDVLDYDQIAFHWDVVYQAQSGPLLVRLFAGASFFRLDADLLDRVLYAQSYPYDSDQVTVTGVETASARDNPVGINGGLGLDLRFARHLGVGAQARFSRAHGALLPAAGAPVRVDAGGLQLAAGVRAYF
jgi:hypothetical protein